MVVVAAVHAFNPSICEAEASEFEARLVYKVSSWTATTTQRNHLKKTKPNQKNQTSPYNKLNVMVHAYNPSSL